MEGKVQVSAIKHVTLDEKWKYFVMTKSDGRRVYCTSYIYYVLQSAFRKKGHSNTNKAAFSA
jgi:hypothetical protein